MQDHLAERKQGLKPGEPAWTVSLDGFASRTGNAAFNTHLSARREIAAEEYLVNHMDRNLLNFVKIDRNFHGFHDTIQAGEVAIARSVRVAVHRPGLKIQPRPLPQQESREYLIRISFAGSATIPVVGVTGDFVRFKIADRKAGRMATFSYTAGGVAFLSPLPFSLTFNGQITKFKTSTPVQLFDFNGPAAFGSPPSAGPFSAGDAQLKIDSPTLLRNGVRIIPRIIPVDTGTSIGVTTFASTEGALLFESEEEFTVDKFEK